MRADEGEKEYKKKEVMKSRTDFCTYGRKSADCTKHGNDVIFFVFLAALFGNLEFWKVKKSNIF